MCCEPEAGNPHLVAKHLIHFTLQVKDDLSFFHGFHNPGDLNRFRTEGVTAVDEMHDRGDV